MNPDLEVSDFSLVSLIDTWLTLQQIAWGIYKPMSPFPKNTIEDPQAVIVEAARRITILIREHPDYDVDEIEDILQEDIWRGF